MITGGRRLAYPLLCEATKEIYNKMLISRLYRDIRLWNLGGGTSEVQKNIIGGLLGF